MTRKVILAIIVLVLLILSVTSCCEGCNTTKVCENRRGHQYSAVEYDSCACGGCKLGYRLVDCYKTCYE